MNEIKENMNISELSSYLNCSISMIRKLIYNGEIPSHQIGNRYYFNRKAIELWLNGKYEKGQGGKA